ncbi:MAG: hypothetical protein CYPHOPRED_004958 [Cyphobasidiales sp. Tagirdzhanova-0007]|nr:MAG: hypothetical protein CYPHOPRED_004958 [Cyphobasidiales sp. Tagirdzhanova-0007]
MPIPKSNAEKAGDTIFSCFTLFTNLFHIGVAAAALSTVSIVTDAANAAAERAVHPFNILVKNATEQFFAPQIAYPTSRWEGIVGNVSGRRRTMTGSSMASSVRGGSLAAGRRNSVLQHSQAGQNMVIKISLFTRDTDHPRSAKGPSRSTSFPAHLSVLDNSIASRRPRRPLLRPLDISSAMIQSTQPKVQNHPWNMSPLTFSTLHPFATPTSASSYASDVSSVSLMPEASYRSRSPANKRNDPNRFYNGEIGRFSFWNLVGMAESGPGENPDFRPTDGSEEDICNIMGIKENEVLVSYEDDASGAVESYKKLSYF